MTDDFFDLPESAEELFTTPEGVALAGALGIMDDEPCDCIECTCPRTSSAGGRCDPCERDEHWDGDTIDAGH